MSTLPISGANQVWLQIVAEHVPDRRETAIRYNTKKVMLKAHGHAAYYDIQLPPEQTALAYSITTLAHPRPISAMRQYPQLIGVLASLADIFGENPLLELITPEATQQVDQEAALVEVAVPDEPIALEGSAEAMALTDSLSNALSAFQPGARKGPLDFIV